MKALLNDRRLETLVDADLQGSAMERPKMSEVVRMLEGDGLAERWEEWEKEEMFRHAYNNNIRHPITNWNLDSTTHIAPDELSGPR